jgi:hypothetical protein
MSDPAPDLFQSIVAWRAWVVEKVDPLRLHSFNGTVWQPYERMEAACRKSHEPPGPRCSCGIYAARNKGHLVDMGYQLYRADTFVVIGSVALWGGVIPGEQGWRAQCAYPRKLLVPYEIPLVAAALKEEYGVPVRLANTLSLGLPKEY